MYATLSEAKSVWIPADAVILFQTHMPDTDEAFCLVGGRSNVLYIHSGDIVLASFTGKIPGAWFISIDYRRGLDHLLETSQQEDGEVRKQAELLSNKWRGQADDMQVQPLEYATRKGTLQGCAADLDEILEKIA